MRERLREQISYDKFQFDRDKGLLSLTATVFRWVLAISVVMWVIMGLVSLRFDLSANFEDIFYSQLIIAGIIAVAMANLYVTEKGGFGGPRWMPYSVLSPTLSGIFSSIGLLLLLWYVWTDFTSGPNELMKITYSLLGVGLCGTFAGFVTLASVSRKFRLLQWATYVLTAVVAVETLDALWTVKVLSVASAGGEFAFVGVVVGLTLGFYTGVATIMSGAKTEKGRTRNLYGYLVSGLIGYGITLFNLWGSLNAGPLRFVYGAAVVLMILAVALGLLHYYEREPLTYRPPTRDDDDKNSE